MEFCFHDDFDITAASLANDIAARGDDTLLGEFKERLILFIISFPSNYRIIQEEIIPLMIIHTIVTTGLIA